MNEKLTVATVKQWSRISDVFNALNDSDILYVVLRNYEELSDENYYMSEHADIDFLTDNRARFAKIIGAYPRFVSDDHIHYFIKINDVDVVVDVRETGDGYYDIKWQTGILNHRTKTNEYYVPDPENYYYSLVYHAILQKEELSEEYLSRLNRLAETINIAAFTEENHLENLHQFMVENGYCYTIPYDIWVPLQKEKIDTKMIKKQLNVRIRDIRQTALDIGSRIKHSVIK